MIQARREEEEEEEGESATCKLDDTVGEPLNEKVSMSEKLK